MQIYRASIVFCFCAMLCHAQATETDQALLNQAREKYDAPFNRNLPSFDCAVDFSWKELFTETTRVGDEGTDEELKKFFQPIRNYVAVTRQDLTVSSGLTDDAIGKFPMAAWPSSCWSMRSRRASYLVARKYEHDASESRYAGLLRTIPVRLQTYLQGAGL